MARYLKVKDIYQWAAGSIELVVDIGDNRERYWLDGWYRETYVGSKQLPHKNATVANFFVSKGHLYVHAWYRDPISKKM